MSWLEREFETIRQAEAEQIKLAVEQEQRRKAELQRQEIERQRAVEAIDAKLRKILDDHQIPQLLEDVRIEIWGSEAKSIEASGGAQEARWLSIAVVETFIMKKEVCFGGSEPSALLRRENYHTVKYAVLRGIAVGLEKKEEDETPRPFIKSGMLYKSYKGEKYPRKNISDHEMHTSLNPTSSIESKVMHLNGISVDLLKPLLARAAIEERRFAELNPQRVSGESIFSRLFDL